jgi:hypothetical protein
VWWWIIRNLKSKPANQKSLNPGPDMKLFYNYSGMDISVMKMRLFFRTKHDQITFNELCSLQNYCTSGFI